MRTAECRQCGAKMEHKGTRGRLPYWCRDCAKDATRQYQRSYYAKNKEAIKLARYQAAEAKGEKA